jgi:glycogen operon protein
MSEYEWNLDFARCLGVQLAGGDLGERDAKGAAVTDSAFILLFNAHDGAIPFVLPASGARRYVTVLDTARDVADLPHESFAGGTAYPLEARSFALLREATPP